MIPSTSTDPTETNIPARSATAFRIADNPYLLELLSSKLYDNLWEAVVRELLTNALDAHKAAGIEHVPVKIELVGGTKTEPAGVTFADFGRGMSPTEFSDVFLKIGQSSKSDSNQQHGGYGIGALTIFAVAEQATLTTIHAGTKYAYLLYRDGDNSNVPTATCLSTSSAEQGEVGTRIHIPVPYAKIREVAGYVASLTCFVRPLPILTGLDSLPRGSNSDTEDPFACYTRFVASSASALTGSNFDFYTDNIGANLDRRRLRIFVMIGDIAYEISIDHVQRYRFSDLGLNSRLLNGLEDSRASYERRAFKPVGDLCIKLPIGSLDLPGNRESLSNTDLNRESIRQAVRLAWPELAAAYAEWLQGAESIGLYYKLNRAVVFGCDRLVVQPPGSQIAVAIKMAQLRDSICWHTNLIIQDRLVTRGTSRALRQQYLTNLDLVYVLPLAAESPLLVVYYLGDPAKANATVKKTYPDAEHLAIRVFESQAALDSALAESIVSLLPIKVVIGSFAAAPRPVSKLPTYAAWIAKAKPPGLRQVDFSGCKVQIEPPIEHPSLRQIKYYFCSDDFGVSKRYCYLGLSQLFEGDTVVYYLTDIARDLVQAADLADWVPAPALFDRLMAAAIGRLILVCRRIGLASGANVWGGHSQVQELKSAHEGLIYTQASLLVLLGCPEFRRLVGDQAAADLHTLNYLLPAATVGFATWRQEGGLFPETALLCKTFVDLEPTLTRDRYWDEFLQQILAPAIAALPLLGSSKLFTGWREHASGYPDLAAAKELVASLPQILFLRDNFKP
jgi:hypothetical protein